MSIPVLPSLDDGLQPAEADAEECIASLGGGFEYVPRSALRSKFATSKKKHVTWKYKLCSYDVGDTYHCTDASTMLTTTNYDTKDLKPIESDIISVNATCAKKRKQDMNTTNVSGIKWNLHVNHALHKAHFFTESCVAKCGICDSVRELQDHGYGSITNWIGCNGCDAWFHEQCLPNNSNADTFLCNDCNDAQSCDTEILPCKSPRLHYGGKCPSYFKCEYCWSNVVDNMIYCLECNAVAHRECIPTELMVDDTFVCENCI